MRVLVRNLYLCGSQVIFISVFLAFHFHGTALVRTLIDALASLSPQSRQHGNTPSAGLQVHAACVMASLGVQIGTHQGISATR